MNQLTNSCWQHNLATGFHSAEALLDYLQLPRTLANPSAEQYFATRVPRGFANRMQKNNPNDPLLLQVLAVDAEMQPIPGYSCHPLQEQAVNPLPGLIHKYMSRVLLTITGACAVNCRFCFRRHFPYEENNPGSNGWSAVFDYIKNDSRITEVILSGGDPLVVKNKTLSYFFENLSAISHVKTIRIHTRIPIVLPERIEEGFMQCIANCKKNIVIVMHCNHPQELDETVSHACQLLRAGGCFLLNQTVYLAGVNNSAAILSELNIRLFEIGVLPYYLHILDKVQGAAHFDASIDEVKTVYAELQTLLPGYLVPRLVVEEPGKLHKTIVK